VIENQIPQEPPRASSNTKWVLLIAGGGCVLLACIAFAVVLAASYLGPGVGGIFSEIYSAPQTFPQSQSITPQPNQKANGLGDPNAPVKIIEYGDFQCPFCRHFWQETEPQVIKTYVATGKAYFEYRSVGAFIGPESAAAAEAAYCAGDQGKFWEYHDALFSNWTGENVGDFAPDKLRRYAATVGLDAAQFDTCLSSGKYDDQVNQDVADAKADGIHATPSFLINGKLVEGDQPFQVFQKAIEDALNGGSENQNGELDEGDMDANLRGFISHSHDDFILRAAANTGFCAPRVDLNLGLCDRDRGSVFHLRPIPYPATNGFADAASH
jgi:protein-disulfide isomerase